MRVKTFISIGLMMLVMLYAAPVYANGIPTLPHAFKGTVTINDDPAPDGTQISAMVAEGEVLTTSQNPIATVNDNYGIDGLHLLVQGYGLSGAITFYVNGVDVEGVTAATFEAGGGPDERNLVVTIPPTIGYSPSSFSFTATEGEANPPSQTLSISNSGVNPTAMDWSVSADVNWLSLNPTSGESSGEVNSVTLSVNIAGMDAGSYSATITILAPGATNTLQTVPVSLAIELAMPLFSVADLSIQPPEVQPNEAVTITVSVANTGGTEGSYTVVLLIEGVKEAEKSVTVAAGSSEIVTFLVTRADVGSYSVAVDGLSASFRVTPEIIGELVETVPAGQTKYVVDASAIANTTITVSTKEDAEVTITVKKYASNPHPEVALPATMIPRYIDIEVDNLDAIDWPMRVEQKYTYAEVAGLVESSLRMYYFKAGAWHRCSSTGVNTATTTIWANMIKDELSGSPVAIGGAVAPAPAPTPGGGGGGGAPAPTPPPPGTIDLSGLISVYGIFIASVIAESEDGLCYLTIEVGTKGLTIGKGPLSRIAIVEVEEPPTSPEDAYIIGLAYDLGPDGATFSPPITLTMKYDPETLPEGCAEDDLCISYWDGEKCCDLETTCYVEANMASCQVSHFTTFFVLGTVIPPAPAAFSASNLSIQPAEVEPNETVTIIVSVANTGGIEGSYSVVLKINGVKEEEKSVTVAAGSSEDVSFSVTREDAASYNVVVDGLSGSFTIAAPAPLEKPPINWPVLGGIIAGVIVVGLLIFFLIRRRAY